MKFNEKPSTKIKYFILVFTVLLGLLSLAVAGDVNTPTQDLTGNWSGTLDTGAIKLRLALRISPTNDGLTGEIDSIDQGAKGLRITRIEFEKPSVKLELAGIGASFVGAISENGMEISGQWKQGGGSLPLTWKRVEKPLVLNRPQEPKKPYPYREEAMTCTNTEAGVVLAGTLTIPKGQGPFAAVVLVPGSGTHDRNESLMGHQPFLVLADYLTQQGIAVLRLDDRGAGGSTGSKSKSRNEDLADDVISAVNWLGRHEAIDPKRIGLIGHSNGGLIAPLAAARDPRIAFIVLMAGPGVRISKLLETQAADIDRASGIGEKQISLNTRMQARAFEIVEHQPDNQLAEKELRGYLAETVESLSAEEQKQMGAAILAGTNHFKEMLSPWFRDFLACDPATALKKTSCPVLALDGEKDLQVSSKENLPAIASALKAGGNEHFQTNELPGLNHLFQTCKTGLPGEYGEIEETIAPAALKLMGDWISDQSSR